MKCPDCDGQGWYAQPDRNGDPEQVQCEGCNCTGEIPMTEKDEENCVICGRNLSETTHIFYAEGNIFCDETCVMKFVYKLEQENKELRTRVAELEGKWTSEGSRCPQCGTGNPNVEELQTRLSTLEKERDKLDALNGTHKMLYEARLEKYRSLLRASEGMEKALEYCATPYMQRITPFADIEERIFTATKALADFRAVKEGV